jgi:hypothetical protein
MVRSYSADEIVSLSRGRNDRQDFTRTIAAHALSKLRNEPLERVARKAFGDVPLLTRAPVTPQSSPVTGVSQTRVGDLMLIAPQSAAAQLFARCMRLDLNGLYTIQVPYASVHAVPLFAGEGLPINIVKSPVAVTTVGPVRKLSFGTTFSRELQNSTPENLSQILGRLLS